MGRFDRAGKQKPDSCSGGRYVRIIYNMRITVVKFKIFVDAFARGTEEAREAGEMVGGRGGRERRITERGWRVGTRGEGEGEGERKKGGGRGGGRDGEREREREKEMERERERGRGNGRGRGRGRGRGGEGEGGRREGERERGRGGVGGEKAGERERVCGWPGAQVRGWGGRVGEGEGEGEGVFCCALPLQTIHTQQSKTFSLHSLSKYTTI